MWRAFPFQNMSITSLCGSVLWRRVLASPGFRGPGGGSFRPLPASRSPRRSLACRGLTPISASLFSWPSLCVCVHISLFYKDISHIGLRSHPNDLILTCLHLRRPYVQIRSHLQGLDIRTSAYPFEGHSSIRDKVLNPLGEMFYQSSFDSTLFK